MDFAILNNTLFSSHPFQKDLSEKIQAKSFQQAQDALSNLLEVFLACVRALESLSPETNRQYKLQHSLFHDMAFLTQVSNPLFEENFERQSFFSAKTFLQYEVSLQ